MCRTSEPHRNLSGDVFPVRSQAGWVSESFQCAMGMGYQLWLHGLGLDDHYHDRTVLRFQRCVASGSYALPSCMHRFLDP